MESGEQLVWGRIARDRYAVAIGDQAIGLVHGNEELGFTATSPFMDLNEQAFLNWNFGHLDPTGAERGGIGALYTAGDLAASMALNPFLKVF